jgi:hypothetical protein
MRPVQRGPLWLARHRDRGADLGEIFAAFERLRGLRCGRGWLVALRSGYGIERCPPGWRAPFKRHGKGKALFDDLTSHLVAQAHVRLVGSNARLQGQAQREEEFTRLCCDLVFQRGGGGLSCETSPIALPEIDADVDIEVGLSLARMPAEIARLAIDVQRIAGLERRAFHRGIRAERAYLVLGQHECPQLGRCFLGIAWPLGTHRNVARKERGQTNGTDAFECHMSPHGLTGPGAQKDHVPARRAVPGVTTAQALRAMRAD